MCRRRFVASEDHARAPLVQLRRYVTGVIEGWTEALQMMKVGSKWKLVLPPELAYGANGTRDGSIGAKGSVAQALPGLLQIVATPLWGLVADGLQIHRILLPLVVAGTLPPVLLICWKHRCGGKASRRPCFVMNLRWSSTVC